MDLYSLLISMWVDLIWSPLRSVESVLIRGVAPFIGWICVSRFVFPLVWSPLGLVKVFLIRGMVSFQELIYLNQDTLTGPKVAQL